MSSTLAVAGFVFVAGVVQGTTGLGYALVASPAIQADRPGRGGVGVVNLLGLVQNLYIIGSHRRQPLWSVAIPLIACVWAGVAVGWWLLGGLDTAQVSLVATVAVLFSLGVLVAGPRIRVGGPLAVAAGIISGVVSLAAGVGGPPIAAYLVQRIPDPDDYLVTQQVVFAAANAATLVVLPLATTNAGSWLSWLAATVLGSWLGLRLRRRVRPELSRRATIALIAVVALVALGRAIYRLT